MLLAARRLLRPRERERRRLAPPVAWPIPRRDADLERERLLERLLDADLLRERRFPPVIASAPAIINQYITCDKIKNKNINLLNKYNYLLGLRGILNSKQSLFSTRIGFNNRPKSFSQCI